MPSITRTCVSTTTGASTFTKPRTSGERVCAELAPAAIRQQAECKQATFRISASSTEKIWSKDCTGSQDHGERKNESLTFHEFQPIPKWIMNVAALYPRNILRFVHFDSRASQSLQQGLIVEAAQGRVRLFRGTKVTLDSEMKLHVPAFKPAPSAPRRLRWFGHFRHSQ